MMGTDFVDGDSYDDAPLDDDYNYYAGNSKRGGVVFLGAADPSVGAWGEGAASEMVLEERKKTHSERVQTFRQVRKQVCT